MRPTFSFSLVAFLCLSALSLTSACSSEAADVAEEVPALEPNPEPVEAVIADPVVSPTVLEQPATGTPESKPVESGVSVTASTPAQPAASEASSPSGG